MKRNRAVLNLLQLECRKCSIQWQIVSFAGLCHFAWVHCRFPACFALNRGCVTEDHVELCIITVFKKYVIAH